MERILKFFTIFTIISVLVLLTITLLRFLGSDQNDVTSTTTASDNLALDRVQQAITSVPEPTQEIVSGEVRIPVNKILNDGKTYKDPANQGSYVLHGDLEYCLDTSVCPDNRESESFAVSLDGRNGIFYVSLLTQPVSAARVDSEKFLKKTLGVTSNELCDLSYYMSVPDFVGSVYEGQHLLFSNCLNSQQL